MPLAALLVALLHALFSRNLSDINPRHTTGVSFELQSELRLGLYDLLRGRIEVKRPLQGANRHGKVCCHLLEM